MDKRAAPAPKETPIDVPSVLSRIGQAARYVLTSVKPDSWMSPGQPLTPIAPETKGRMFDYPVAVNTQYTPRVYEGVSFPELRALAQSWDLIAILIETRKDQMVKIKWSIKPREKKDGKKGVDAKDDEGNKQPPAGKPKAPLPAQDAKADKLLPTNEKTPGKAPPAPGKPTPNAKAPPVEEDEPTIEDDPRVAELQQLFLMPDGINPWQQWLRMLLHEMLVIDAAVIYPRMKRGGGLYALELMDGATIKKVIDEDGRVPVSPDPAYQQILKGMPASDYTRDELIYAIRNPRVNKMYGYSPVEQIITTINIGIRREIHKLQSYTEGNLPNLLIAVPPEWNATQLETLARFWEARLDGNTANRSKAMFVPGGTEPYDIKAEMLKDEFDEWLARIACFAFSMSPQPFIKMVNRGNQESMQETALSEGLVPIMQWVKDLMDVIIWKYKGYTDLEFGWEIAEDQDPNIKSQIQEREIRVGKISIDEARLDDGREPIGMPNAYMGGSGPMLLTPFIDGTADGQPAPPAQQLMPGDPIPGKKGPDGKPGPSLPGKPTVLAPPEKKPNPPNITAKKPPPKFAPAVKFEKFAAVSPDRLAVRIARAAMTEKVRAMLRRSAPIVAKELSDALVGVLKASGGDQARIDAALKGVTLNWTIDPTDYESVFRDANTAAAEVMVGEDGISHLIEKLNQNAKDWAEKRAAELVGKQVLDDGSIIDNPNPEWAITESTRNMLRETVTRAYDEGWTPDALAREIEDGYAFSNDRANMIARTELKLANSEGQMDGYRATGLSLKKNGCSPMTTT